MTTLGSSYMAPERHFPSCLSTSPPTTIATPARRSMSKSSAASFLILSNRYFFGLEKWHQKCHFSHHFSCHSWQEKKWRKIREQVWCCQFHSFYLRGSKNLFPSCFFPYILTNKRKQGWNISLAIILSPHLHDQSRWDILEDCPVFQRLVESFSHKVM